MKKIEITVKQAEKFNEMRNTLRRIAGTDKDRSYMSPDEIRKHGDMDDYEEELGMAYENIQCEARAASSGVRAIEIEKPKIDHGVTVTDYNL